MSALPGFLLVYKNPADRLCREVTHRKGRSHMGTIIGEGITFDDVLLVPAYSEVTPNMVDLTTNLTAKIKHK